MKTVIKFLFSNPGINGVGVNLGLLIGRLGFGLMLAFLHGLGKIPPAEKFIAGVDGLGFPVPALFAWAAALAEFLGSLLVAIGLMTRPAAFAVVFTMCVAAFLRHGDDPLAKKELALLYLAFGLIYLFVGAGKYSLDWLVNGRKK